MFPSASASYPFLEATSMRTQFGFLAALSLLLACDGYSDGNGPGGGSTASVVVVSAAGRASSLRATIGGTQSPAIAPGGSNTMTVPEGTRSYVLAVQGAGVTGSSGTIDLVAGQTYLLVAQDSQGTVVGSVVADTGALVPAGKSKLRVIHSAGLAPAIDVYRTQPDFPSLVSVMFPFDFGAVSPYLQSDPGTWTVVVTPDNSTDTLYASGPIVVPDGERVSVVLVDSTASGGISAVVLPGQ